MEGLWAGYVADETDSYRLVWIGAAAVSAIAALIMLATPSGPRSRA